jgi:hypothetical protein
MHCGSFIVEAYSETDIGYCLGFWEDPGIPSWAYATSNMELVGVRGIYFDTL